MQKLRFLILISLGGLSLHAQTDENFEGYGKIVFESLILNGNTDSISLVRVRELREFIAARITQPSKRDEMVYKADNSFSSLEKTYQESLIKVITTYNKASRDGVRFKYQGTYYTEKEDGLDDTYTFMVSFLYQTNEVQNEVQLTFDVAWYLDMFLWISPVADNF